METVAERIELSSPAKVTPWLKWPGGKRRFAAQLSYEIMAVKPKLYVEPFLGGGAIALALPSSLPKVLADSNPHLIDCWLCVQNIPGTLFAELHLIEITYGNDQAGYLAARTEFNKILYHPRKMWARRSALFLYLNARCFNGLWRVSAKGTFNVPFGKRPAPTSISAEEMMGYSSALRGCSISSEDFVILLSRIGREKSILNRTKHLEGIALFSDSPYSGTFDKYTKTGFDDEDQRTLAAILRAWASSGAAVWATNTDTPLIREIYSWAQIEETREQHSVGSKGDRRGKRACLMIRGGAACRG